MRNYDTTLHVQHRGRDGLTLSQHLQSNAKLVNETPQLQLTGLKMLSIQMTLNAFLFVVEATVGFSLPFPHLFWAPQFNRSHLLSPYYPP